MSKNKKEIITYSLIAIIVTNILWLTGLSIKNIFGNILSTLACFIPLIIALIMSNFKLKDLKIKPNIKKSWKTYLLSIVISIIIVYATDLIPLLFFPKEVLINSESLTIAFILKILLFTIFGIVLSIELLGEEIGWMGYLYPRLEKEYGMFKGAVLLSTIRTLFHLILLLFIYENTYEAVIGILFLFIYNFILESTLIYVTKKSNSVFPASIIHSITNTLAVLSFVIVSEKFTISIPFRLVGIIPNIIIGSIFYILLYKTNHNEK